LLQTKIKLKILEVIKNSHFSGVSEDVVWMRASSRGLHWRLLFCCWGRCFLSQCNRQKQMQFIN